MLSACCCASESLDCEKIIIKKIDSQVLDQEHRVISGFNPTNSSLKRSVAEVSLSTAPPTWHMSHKKSFLFLFTLQEQQLVWSCSWWEKSYTHTHTHAHDKQLHKGQIIFCTRWKAGVRTSALPLQLPEHQSTFCPVLQRAEPSRKTVWRKPKKN